MQHQNSRKKRRKKNEQFNIKSHIEKIIFEHYLLVRLN